MSEGIQIEIPAFDDDEYSTTPIPFGRPQGFQFGQGSFVTPPIGGASSTPIMANTDQSNSPVERSYSHARGDSFASESSSYGHGKSAQSFSARNTSFGHAPTSSVATSITSAPSRKSSFASIKSAFKGLKTTASDAPPVPSLDTSAYPPSLRNPFSRAGSSRNVSLPTPSNSSRRRPSAPSPSPSHTGVSLKSVNISSPLNVHSRAKSGITASNPRVPQPLPTDHSPSDSITHYEVDPRSQSPLVSQKVPSQGRQHAIPRHSPSFDASPELEPRTPAEYALHAVFVQFVTVSEQKIQSLLQETLTFEPPLVERIGPGTDVVFDKVLDSLTHIAQRQAKAVIDALTRWKKGLSDQAIPPASLQQHVSGLLDRNAQMDTKLRLAKRREVVATYIYCRTLISIVASLGKDSLDDEFANELETIMFREFVRSYESASVASANQKSTSGLFSVVLGHLANRSFMSVTDHYLHELRPLTLDQGQKESDPRLEHLLTGLRHLEIKVWPPEQFEIGAEFMESLAFCFKNAHGFKMKSVFAENLTYLLHPLGKNASAEFNIPSWVQAIDHIYPKAAGMITNPKYWSSAFPLAVTALCVGPQDFFRKNWSALCDFTMTKLLKERSFRSMLKNGLVRIIWTYLYHCQENPSTIVAKIDSIIRLLLPVKKRIPEDMVDTLTFIVHFILSRPNLDYGADLIMEIIQESSLSSANASTNPDVIAPERVVISVRSGLLSLTNLENKSCPSWPSNCDFHAGIPNEDYPFLATSLPAPAYTRPDIQQIVDRLGSMVARIAVVSFRAIGHLSVLDPRHKYEHQTMAHEERGEVVVRHHPDGVVCCYSRSVASLLGVIQACFDSWPRLLHSSLPFGDVLDMLTRCVEHVEPAVADSAVQSICRLASESRSMRATIRAVSRSLFGSADLSRDNGWRLVSGHSRRIDLWHAVVAKWSAALAEGDEEQLLQPELNIEDVDSLMLLDEIEGGALFLLASTSKRTRDTALKVLRMVPELRNSSSSLTRESMCLIDILGGKHSSIQVPVEGSLLIPDSEIERLNKWREANLPDYLLRLLESENPLDHSLWGSILPLLMKACMDHCPHVLDICRESLNVALLRYHPIMSSLAGMSSKATPQPTHRHPNSSGRTNLGTHDLTAEQYSDVQQWRFWTAALCSCTRPADIRPATAREHARVPSDPSNQRERLSSSRGLFRLLIPFLACDSSLFRDSVVSALGSVHQSSFKTLLEDMQSISAHIYDDGILSHVPRGTASRSRNQDHLHIAVVRVYALTARFVREPQISSDASAMNLLLNFVRATEGFLSQPDVRIDWEMNRLRRYFCHIVEQLFAILPLESDRSLDPNLRLRLFRLCEDWCPYGSTPAHNYSIDVMRRHLMSMIRDVENQRIALDRFQKESAALAPSAAAAMSSLCYGAFHTTTSDGQTKSPPLSATEAVDWISALLGSDKNVHQAGKKALRSLLSGRDIIPDLLDAVVRASYSSTSSSASDAFFVVISSVIVETDSQPFDFLSSLWLGLVQLGRSSVDIRRRALQVLVQITRDGDGGSLLQGLNAAIRSSAPNIYLFAQQKAASILATVYESACFGIISQAALRMPQTREGQQRSAFRCLHPWIAMTHLMTPDHEIPPQGYGALKNLFSLTVRYSETHSDMLQSLWCALVEGEHEANGSAVTKFLIEQATIRSSPSFLSHARKIIAYLSRTRIGSSVFISLCSIIEPPSMILAQAPEPRPAKMKDTYFIEDFDVLLPVTSRQPLAPAELALLFLGDYALDEPWEYNAHLPSLLQISFTLLDHRVTNIRIQARRVLFHILRSWVSPSNQYLGASEMPVVLEATAKIDSLEEDINSSGNPSRRIEDRLNDKLPRLCDSVVQLLTPVLSTIKSDWTETALQWGVQCPQRDAACRSLQIFRTLSPVFQPPMAMDLIDRLANTISDPSGVDSKFSNEILLTLIDICSPCSPPKSVLPQMFWCASAALLTTAEAEFLLAIRLMNSVLDSFNLGDPDEVELIRSRKPPTWESRELCIERLVYTGLRSSRTVFPSYHLLARVLATEGFDVVEAADNRLRLAYVAILPWCLHCIETNIPHETLTSTAEELAKIAAEENRPDIHRILTSVSKNSFKRKEDFVRQAMSSIRENYWVSHASEIVTILLGCILNEESWLRFKSLQILKVLLQNTDSRKPFSLSGSEQLMPLLRLLDTDMASQAMEVLNTPMVISGGPSARQVLRMSLHGLPPMGKTADTVTFGTPSESGWSIAQPEEQSTKCRRNLASLISTFNVTEPRHLSGTMSMISFAESESHSMRAPAPPFTSEDQSSDTVSLSELVSQLHDINAFFKSDQSSFTHLRMPPRFDAEDAERRVAAILSRSLARTPNGREDISRGSNTSRQEGHFTGNIPPTPFVDLFGGSPFNSAEALHQNFMSMAEDFEEDDYAEQNSFIDDHSYHTTTVSGTPNHPDVPEFEPPLHQSTPRPGGHEHVHPLRDDSDSEYEFSAFTNDDSMPQNGQGWPPLLQGSHEINSLQAGEALAARRTTGRPMDATSSPRSGHAERNTRRRV